MTAIKNEKGQPFVENEYQLYRDRNTTDWGILHLRFEDGQGAGPTQEESGSTNVHAVDRMTRGQFMAWSTAIDQMLTAVARV